LQISSPDERSEYEFRAQREQAAYRECTNVHDLPPIHDYWHFRHLLPKFRAFGFSSPGEMFQIELEKRCRSRSKKQRIVSIGSGNCDLELDLALFLKGRGLENFVIECLDLNADMLERGLAAAVAKGVPGHIEVQRCDFNSWEPLREYDVVLAHQSLHHVVNLEGLYRAIYGSLVPDGVLITSDMIGRNGHMRWPEALVIVHEFWRQLPGGYRYNQQLKRYEDLYDNWDCSKEGFEGIRAQDVLPLLVEHFHFEMFLGFGNVIDPFVDRGFGHNFWPQTEWDRNFIDRVHERDEAEMRAGTIKPTHMLAVLQKEAPERMRYLKPMTPEFSIRTP
jgi:SAM-dependent methyltransferase